MILFSRVWNSFVCFVLSSWGTLLLVDSEEPWRCGADRLSRTKSFSAWGTRELHRSMQFASGAASTSQIVCQCSRFPIKVEFFSSPFLNSFCILKNVTDQGDVFWFQSLNSTGLEWRMFSNDMSVCQCICPTCSCFCCTYHLSLKDWPGSYTCTGVQDLSFHWMRNSCVTRLQFCGSDAKAYHQAVGHLRWCTSFSRTGSAREMLGVFHSFLIFLSFRPGQACLQEGAGISSFFYSTFGSLGSRCCAQADPGRKWRAACAVLSFEVQFACWRNWQKIHRNLVTSLVFEILYEVSTGFGLCLQCVWYE